MHAKFSSFIRPKRRTKVEHTNNVYPFSVPPPPAPDVQVLISSPHPYGSADVFDISPDARSISSSDGVQPSETLINPYSPTSPLYKQHHQDKKPSIQLDLDLGLKTLTELVPAHLLDQEAGAEAVIAHKDPEGVFLDDGGDESTSEDSMLRRLTSMDASDFMSTQGQSDSSRQSSLSKSKRSPPAPIHIPPNNDAATSTSVAKLPRITSQPNTASTLGESSSVSGTTLARALIANTYAFSVESEMSPFHRVLIRADSATLPSADSPYSTAPDMPPIPSNAEEVYVPPLVSRTEDPSQKKMESLSAREPLASPISVSSPGMSDVLDYYESSVDRERSPALSSAGFKPAFTPITEESPQASTYSPSVSSKITQKELSLGYNSPSTGSAPINWSNFRRASHSKREASIDGRTAALFPIGARAASIPVTPGVFSSAAPSSDSTPNASGPSSLPPLTRPIFNRERSGSTPSPIQVIRDPRDTKSYYLTAASDIGGDSPRNSSEGDHGRQTFPETAVSTTWSASVHGHRGTTGQRLSVDRSRFPQTPNSEAGGHMSLSQQIMRTASPNIGLTVTPTVGIPTSGESTAIVENEASRTAIPFVQSSVQTPSATDNGDNSLPKAPTLEVSDLSARLEVPNDTWAKSSREASSSYSPSPPPYELGVSPPQSSNSHSNNKALVPGTVPRPERVTSVTGHPRRTSTVGSPRPRPPFPSGPRRPSVPTSGLSRVRHASESIVSPRHSSSQSLSHDFTTYPTPLFLPPECRWKGHTLEAAKWTFTSETLQGIVGQAIRQSASESRIRLLAPEILEEELPNEIRGLERKQLLLKTEYQVLCQRRAAALRELTAHGEAEPGSPGLRRLDVVVKEVKETCISLDKLAEDLHSADEQLSQLRLLEEVHSTSALAMALRKLNSSFVRELSEHQKLKDHVDALEEEREEAWKQAQAIASELDNLHTTSLHPVSSRSSMVEGSKRSSQVQLSRMASERVSKAGLRSQRSSMHSTQRLSLVSIPRSRYSVDGASIPPVPLLRAGSNNAATRRSSRALSLDGGGSTTSPNSDYRGMMQAQEELLELLGLSGVTNGEPVVEGNVYGHNRDSTLPVPRPRSFYGLSRRSESE